MAVVVCDCGRSYAGTDPHDVLIQTIATEHPHSNLRSLSERVTTLELVLIDLFRENAHILVGGVAFAEDSIYRLLGKKEV